MSNGNWSQRALDEEEAKRNLHSGSLTRIKGNRKEEARGTGKWASYCLLNSACKRLLLFMLIFLFNIENINEPWLISHYKGRY